MACWACRLVGVYVLKAPLGLYIKSVHCIRTARTHYSFNHYLQGTLYEPHSYAYREEAARRIALGGISEHQCGGESSDDARWQRVYDARTSFYEDNIGPLPDDILKMNNMLGVWPGGGLFAMPATALGNNVWAYTTFGLSNSDMPATTAMVNFNQQSDGERTTDVSGELRAKTPANTAVSDAGYGYEIMMLTNDEADWPLGFMQWVVNAEITHDVGLLNRVETYQGLTVQEIQVAENVSINVLIAKAQGPLPKKTQLPNGTMELLIATVITDDEMQWSMQHGRDALLTKLYEAGIGQVSVLGRESIL